MVDLESIVANMPGQEKILPALKILVDAGILSALARANANQLVEGRVDSDDEAVLAKEVRDVRQTNRILLGLEESARQITKEIDNA